MARARSYSARRNADGGSGTDPVEGVESRTITMQRGVSQLLFNYLPGRTVDWEDGLAIVYLENVRLSKVWEEEQTIVLLDEIANLLDRWRIRGGTVDRQMPDPRSERGRFAVGLPEAITGTVLDTAVVCSRCSALSFPKQRQIAGLSKGQFRCQVCRTGALRQVPFVFVHGCGELAPIREWIPATHKNDDGTLTPNHRPIRCSVCGPSEALVFPPRSERVRDIYVTCTRCGNQVIERFTARCGRCLNEANRKGVDGNTDENTIVTRIAMRMSRYSASDTYYPQTLSMLRLDRPPVVVVNDELQGILRRMLPSSRRPTAAPSSPESLIALSRRLQAAEAAGNSEEVTRIRAAIADAAMGRSSAQAQTGHTNFAVSLAPDLERGIQESIAFRETVTSRPAGEVAARGGGASELLLAQIVDRRKQLGLSEIQVVDDLPVITSTFGYTRRHFEPTYAELSAEKLPTEIRAFPSLDRFAAQRLGRADLMGTVPILAREGEHEGLFLSLDPVKVGEWLHANGVPLPFPDLPLIVRMLAAFEPVDRYYDDIWTLPARRMIFGLLHTFSHMTMRAVSRFAGIERTSLSEYMFLPLLGTVIFDNSSAFKLGGIETMVRDQLMGFLDELESSGSSCLYDPSCIDHKGACHGCVHSPEICCRVFNHGLSRAFVIGGHAPWADTSSDTNLIGYWSIEANRV